MIIRPPSTDPSPEAAEPAEPVENSPFDITNCVVYDVECYRDRWMVGFLSYDPQGRETYDVVDGDREKLIEVLNRLATADRLLVGYNSKNYDRPMLLGIMYGYDPYEISCALIERRWGDLPGELGTVWERPSLPCDEIDLSERIRKGQFPPSLKLVAARLCHARLQDLPFAPDRVLTDEEWALVKGPYNKNDLEITLKLLRVLVPELESLTELSRELDFDLRSVPPPKLCEELFRSDYRAQKKQWPRWTPIPDEFWYEPPAGVMRPRTPGAAEWFDAITMKPITMVGPLPELGEPDKRKPSVPKLSVEIGGKAYTIKKGGLHSKDTKGLYYRTKKHRIVQVDVDSYYPSIVVKNDIWPKSLEGIGQRTYEEILLKRLEIKRRSSETTDPEERRRLGTQSIALKLALNSFYGKLGSPYSKLHEPQCMLGVTLTGQLMMVDLIERLVAAKISILSANTDGLTVRLRRKPKVEARFEEILKSWQADTGMSLGIEEFSRFVSTAANGYAHLSIGKKIKRAGKLLKGKISPGESPNYLIINDAVVNALLMDVPPERTIWGCKDLARFCSITQTTETSNLVFIDSTGLEVELPRVVRWYKAKPGPTSGRLFRRTSETDKKTGAVKKKETNVEGGECVSLALDLPDGPLPHDIDYPWYVEKARTLFQSVPGYFHQSRRPLSGHPEATRLYDLGLLPCPKWSGKFLVKGTKAGFPTTLWDYQKFDTFACYTGPKVGVLVIDVDDPALFWAWVDGLGTTRHKPGASERWESFHGCLASFHGSGATAEAVRAGECRGKMIFRFILPEGRTFKQTKNETLLKKHGFEAFYGQGVPSIIGEYVDKKNPSVKERYVLEGDTLTPAPDWLIAKFTSKSKPKKPKTAMVNPALLPFLDGIDPDAALDRLTTRLIEIDAAMDPAIVGWAKKTVGDNGDGDGHLILVGRCPFDHTSGTSNDGDLCAGYTTDLKPYVKCQHSSCSRIPEINGLLRLPQAPPPRPARETPDDEPAVKHEPAVNHESNGEIASEAIIESTNEVVTEPVTESKTVSDAATKAVTDAATEAAPGAVSEAVSDPSVNGRVTSGIPAPPRPGAPPPPPPPPVTPPDPNPGPDLTDRPCTDLGNAERMINRFGENLMHSHPWKKWLCWDGRRWKLDDSGAARDLAANTVRSIYMEAAQEPDPEKRKALAVWAFQSESRDHINAMTDLARDKVPIDHQKLDQNPWLLNVPNGTLDLRSGTLRPPQRGDLITTLSPVVYDEHAKCPNWEETLVLVLGGDKELIAYFQRLCGLCLTGAVTEQILPILHGEGSNGKSTILTCMLDILGPDLAMKAKHNFLMMKKNPEHLTEMASLRGKRLVVAIESGEGQRINETMVKELTGSDRIRARRMREDEWEFYPTHKILLCTNHEPVIKGIDYAIWRRIHKIPFEVTITPDMIVKDMPERLKAEYPGILAWAVRGCSEWLKLEGLNQPEKVSVATETYRAEQDVVQRFIDEECEINPTAKPKVSTIYAAYRRWAENSGEYPISQKDFGIRLGKKGHKSTKSGCWFYHGIELRPRLAPVQDQRPGK